MRIHQLIEEHNEVFYKEPWYGEPVMKTLISIPFHIANAIPVKTDHSIAILVDHMIKWKRFVIEKLWENKDFDIEMNSDSDWNQSLKISTEQDWQNLIDSLKSSHENLIQLLLTKDDDWLSKETAGKTYSNGHLIRGAIHHDIYHLGQIRLIKRMVE